MTFMFFYPVIDIFFGILFFIIAFRIQKSPEKAEPFAFWTAGAFVLVYLFAGAFLGWGLKRRFHYHQR